MNDSRYPIEDPPTPKPCWQRFSYPVGGDLPAGDDEVLQDLGYPTSPDDVARHYNSGKSVEEMMDPLALGRHAEVVKLAGNVVCGDCARVDCSGCKY